MKLYHLILLFFTTLFFSGCISNNTNLVDYTQNLTTKMKLDNVCKPLYSKEKATVAVVNFTNNSGFGIANSDDKSENTSAGIGVSIIGVGIGAESSSSKSTRMVDPKLAGAFIPQIEQMLMETGNVELFTRSDYDKVDAELKLQDSGLLEPNSAVEFGQNSGVKYLVTGSIDYVEHNHKDYSRHTQALSNATKYSNDDKVKMTAAALNFVTAFFDGTIINTSVTIKILDVATGKVMFSKQIKNETKINSKKAPSYGQLVGAIKTNISNALPTIQEHFSTRFTTSGYITKIKHTKDDEEEIIVQINFGSNDNVKEDDRFIIKKLETTTDPLTNKISCEKIPTNIELQATKHIYPTYTWTKVSQGEAKDIKLLQLVERK
jgi:hypothetical protein